MISTFIYRYLLLFIASAVHRTRYIAEYDRIVFLIPLAETNLSNQIKRSIKFKCLFKHTVNV